MTSLDKDIESLENVLRHFFQSVKKPSYWASVTADAGVSIDRPSAFILHTLLSSKSSAFRVQDLALQLGVEAPSITRKTQQLEQAGYLSRNPDPNDRRAVSLTLTKRGKEVSSLLWNSQRKAMRQALRHWSATDRKNFVELFDRFCTDLANKTAHS